jgi:hypothetical protein
MGNEPDFPEWDSNFEVDGNWDYDFGDGLVNGTQSASPEASDDKTNEPSDGSKSKSGEHEKRKEPPEGTEAGDSEPKRRGGCPFFVSSSQSKIYYTLIIIRTNSILNFLASARLPFQSQ